MSLAFFAPTTSAQNLTDDQLGIISARLAESALESWELGTRSQAILELNATRYSVFSNNPLPPPTEIPSNLTSVLTPFFNISKSIVSGRARLNDNTQGAQPLIPDGSAADPASNGMGALIANWTGQDRGQVDYAGAAKDQLDFLYQNVPKTSDGALSHRVSQVQLWSDFVYMVPPFLAYYGVVSQNRTLLEDAYTQIKLYRNYLRDSKANMWKHVLLGTSGNDEGFWSTGNGWAAAGMLRVLATIKQSEFANSMKNEQKDLGAWTREILDGIYPHADPSTSLFTNYADQPATADGNFLDAASTALVAAATFRLAVLWNDVKHVPNAEKARVALFSPANNASDSGNSTSSLNGFQHLTSEGWLTPVVNPHSYGEQGKESPEGQAFVVDLHSAWRDWVADGAKGANAAARMKAGAGTIGTVLGFVLLMVL
ncbi:Six-hairpin glycosidase-like protein [Crucibulum laeve]|uniref:Six-hairpin glycosidase-like protein n=1 Tax=Crucibulum laeve TaxID=68775 RepID=A0A5C3LT96_9AGAR|nr:Six-hairpin glycosidase-like protein [Crucibulum laeve]